MPLRFRARRHLVFALLPIAACGGRTIATTAADGGSDGDTPFDDAGPVPTVPPSFEGGFPPPDAGFFDTSPGPDASPPPLRHAKIQLINAATNVIGGSRVCPAIGTRSDGSDGTVGPVPALPHDDAHPMPGTMLPGIPIGASATLPDLTDLGPKALTWFTLDPSKIPTDVKSNPNERTCDVLIGPTGQGGVLLPGRDFRRLPTIPAGVFLRGKSFAITFFDCTPNAGGAIGCAGTSQLGVVVNELDKVVADPTKSGVAVANLSTPLWNPMSAGLNASLGLCGPKSPIAFTVPFGSLAPTPPTPETGLAASMCDLLVFEARQTDMTVRFTSNAHPLDGVSRLSGGLLFAPGANYTFVVLGDPSAPESTTAGGGDNPLYDGRGVHVIALANDPALPPL